MNHISITSRLRPAFVTLSLVVLSAVSANGQPVPQGYPTLEWKCHQSALIIRGSIKGVELAAGGVRSDNYNEYAITVAVTEWFKGDQRGGSGSGRIESDGIESDGNESGGNESDDAVFGIGLSNTDADYARSRIETDDEFLIFLESDGNRFRLHGNGMLATGLLPFLTSEELAADPFRGRCHVWRDFSGQMLTTQQLAELIPDVVEANSRFEITGSTEIRASYNSL